MAPDLTELILDRAHNAAVSLDEQGLVTYWNPSAERIFGLQREQAMGRPIADLVIPEHLRAAHVKGFRRFLDDGVGPVLDRRIELVALRADGSEFPVEMTISALGDGVRWSFHAFIQDISERVAGERERERLVEELRGALRGSEQRFEAVVGSLADPVTIRDREHRFVYANSSAVEYLGFDSWEQLRVTPPAAIMSDYRVSREDGSPVEMKDIPSVRILAGEPADPLLIRTVHSSTGMQRWNLLKAAPLLDESGAVEATITIIEDVTEQKRAELSNAMIARVAGELASSLDYEQTLRNVAELAVPGIVDWCAVDLLDEDGERRTVAVAHVDPQRVSLAEELRAYVPERLDPGEGLGRVLSTGEALLYPEISEEMLVQAAVDEHHLDLLRGAGFRSALIVPMLLGARTLGAMTLVSAESDRVLDRFDLELAQQVAARAAVAIENSRLYSERSRIARTLQQSLLPDTLPEIAGYDLASIYRPALETSLVGGDFYDVWQVGESWMLLIGDVTGKGIEAAALTALVRHTIRSASEFESSPAGLLAFVDATLKKRAALSLCTALCLRLCDGRVELSVGGHPLPLRLTPDGVVELGSHGPLLGAFAEAGWEDHVVELAPGETLLAYTDGMTDAKSGERERFGFERLLALVSSLRCESPEAMLAGVDERLSTFQSGPRADDTAAIALRRWSYAGTPQETAGRARSRIPT
jgi:PAS domain S-box-containing protein